ncbi:MAG: hypothetical protein ABL985_06320 [Casimicrobium sp.]
MNYFSNESETRTLAGGIVVENHVDRIRFGEIDITRDCKGLATATTLLASARAAGDAATEHRSPAESIIHLANIVSLLEQARAAGSLPDEIVINQPTAGPSIFGTSKPSFLK